MKELRLAWEPESLCSPEMVSEQVMRYMDGNARFAQFANDTCLMLKPVSNLAETIEGALREARRLAEFKVYRMEQGDYLVFFAGPLLVYVGRDEFLARTAEIQHRISELKFSEEHIVPTSQQKDETNVLVGLYARGKLQRDAWSPLSYILVEPTLGG